MNKRIKFIYLVIALIIIIILVVAIIILGIKSNCIDYSHLLGAISNIFGGIIGVIGGFILFRYQFYYTKDNESKFSSKILYELLDFTVSETENIIDYMIDVYIGSYVNGYTLSEETEEYKILKKKIKEEHNGNYFIMPNKIKINFISPYKAKTFPYLVQCLGLEEVVYLLQEQCIVNEKDNQITVDCKCKRPKDTIKKIIKEFRKLESIEDIIYYENWKESINKIIDIELKGKSSIFRWLSVVNKNIVKMVNEEELIVKDINNLEQNINSEKKCEEIDKNYEELFSLNRELHMKKIQMEKLKKDIVSHISKFIYYRDLVIEILNKYNKEKKLKTSTEKMNEKFDSIKIVE